MSKNISKLVSMGKGKEQNSLPTFKNPPPPPPPKKENGESKEKK